MTPAEKALKENSAKKDAEFSTPAPGVTAHVSLLARLRYYLTFVVAGLCFLILGVPLIPLGILLKKLTGNRDFIYPFGKFGARLYLRTAGARVRVSGRENLNLQQPYIFVANHQSNLDPPMMIAYLDRNPSFLAKKELFRIPVFRQGIELIDVTPIDRRDREAAVASTRLAAEKLQRGISYVGFPEGTRSVDGRLKEFRKGLFHMALAARVPVVPVVINDTRLVMRKGKNYCLPGDVSLQILPPVGTDGYSSENIEELINTVRSRFLPHVKTD
jgi:1-acyl-sn-glycerol-3-phosphate acyltransferase